MTPEPDMFCKSCRTVYQYDDLEEQQAEESYYKNLVCPDCGGKEFIKHPPEDPRQYREQEQPEPPEPPDDVPEEHPPEPTMDQERERKRQAWVRSLVNSNRR